MRELNRDEINKVSGGWDFSSGVTTSTPSSFRLGSGSYSHDYNGYSGTSNHSYSWGGANKTRLSQWKSCFDDQGITHSKASGAIANAWNPKTSLENIFAATTATKVCNKKMRSGIFGHSFSIGK